MKPEMFLQEQQRDTPLIAQLDEVRALLCGLAESTPFVRDDADRMTVQVCANPVTSVVRTPACNSANSLASTRRAITSRTS